MTIDQTLHMNIANNIISMNKDENTIELIYSESEGIPSFKNIFRHWQVEEDVVYASPVYSIAHGWYNPNKIISINWHVTAKAKNEYIFNNLMLCFMSLCAAANIEE